MDFLAVAAAVAICLLIWDCVEVGRNDAANLVNAVFGSRVLERKKAVLIAGFFVILGATFSSPVMNTVMKGIFDVDSLTAEMAVSVFLSAYVVDTVLLYVFSAFGMPVSTTATLVFSLAGGAVGVAGALNIVHWSTLGNVMATIVGSIVLSAIAGFMVQRIFRGSIRHKVGNHVVMMLHGPWITGAILTGLSWFMIVKGLQTVPAVNTFKIKTLDAFGTPGALLVYWGALTLLTHLVLTVLGRKGTKYLFHFNTIFGMICLSFAFGQNDLANCAAPGIAAFQIWQGGDSHLAEVPRWGLFICSFLMFLGMTTKTAQRVTRAEVNTGSEFDKVALWAPKWALKLGRLMVKKQDEDEVLAPAPRLDPYGKRIHYDTLRASVIMAVSASVIAFASGLGIPVSTTYVGFATVISTGMADRVFSRGQADLKMGRAIWVISCWFWGAGVAALASGFVSATVYKLGTVGIVIVLAINLMIRFYFRKRADRHEQEHHGKFEHADPKLSPLKRESIALDEPKPQDPSI